MRASTLLSLLLLLSNMGVSVANQCNCDTETVIIGSHYIPPSDPEPLDPVNLTQDTDILGADGNELIAGHDAFIPGMKASIRVKGKAKGGDAGNWKTRDSADTIDIAYYVSYDDGPWTQFDTGYMTIGKLDEDETITETKSMTIPEGIASIAFRAYLDYRDEVDEYDEGDNESRVERFEVTNLKPDYAVTDVFFSDTETGVHYRDGDTVLEDRYWYPYCEVSSIGETNAPIDVRVSHRMDGSERDTDTLKTSEISLGLSYREVVWGKWKLGDTGNRVYQCCVDSKGWLPETNEANNCKSMTLNVVPWKSDIVASDLYLKTDTGQVVRNGSSIPEDSIVRPYCTAYNQGNRDVLKGTRLRYDVDSGNYRGDDGVDASDLRVGASKTEYMSNGFRLGDTGNRTYRCCVDYKGEESELSEGNNCSTIAFTVYPVSPRMEITDIYGRYNGHTIRDGSVDKAGKDFAPNITFRNVGNGPMKCKAHVDYYVNRDKRRDGDTIDPLGVGQSGHEYVSSKNDFKLGDKGWRTYRARVVSDCGEFPSVERTISFRLK